MTGGRRRDDDAFSEAMQGVKPLADRDKLRPRAAPRPEVRRAAVTDAEPVHFEVERSGERVAGRAPGIDRRHLRRLRSGSVPVDVRIDLHGLLAADAREAVRQTLQEAAVAGQRCALVIHGRGQHSQGGPVLKDALPRWLAEPPLGDMVMAFASATPADGGPGATYVLLRRGV